MYLNQHIIGSDDRYLPQQEDEKLNHMILAYETDSQRLRTMKEEYDVLSEVAENITHLKCIDQLQKLLSKEEEIIISLEENTELLKEAVKRKGVEVA